LPVNTGTPWPSISFEEAEERVLRIQTKLHRRAADDPKRRFCDLFNLVCDPAFLLVAWRRVKGNKGARTAGVDGQTARYIANVRGEEVFLAELRADLKARSLRPLPVKERLIPKAGGKVRRLGVSTVRDRVVQASLKLVLEPILEAGFRPSSYGYRPNRRAQDAIAEIHHLCSRSYEWVLEGDIEACFDEISHSAAIERLRNRIGDRRVLALVKAFLKAGILTQDGRYRDTITGTPQGGILSPLIANVALSVLDDHFAEAWTAMGSESARHQRRGKGLVTYRLVRYADDFVVLVFGTKEQVEALREEVAAVLAPMGLRLSEEKTGITHIDEGFDFLGFRIQRRRKRGTDKRHVYTYPSKAALARVKGKVRERTREVPVNQPLATLLLRLNRVLRGWANFFRHGVSKATFSYLDAFAWRRVLGWLRRKHPKADWKKLRRDYLPGWRPTDGKTTLFNPARVPVTRYRYRGARIPTPWSEQSQGAVG
jgi:RNA-directed DNA polymerase